MFVTDEAVIQIEWNEDQGPFSAGELDAVFSKVHILSAPVYQSYNDTMACFF